MKKHIYFLLYIFCFLVFFFIGGFLGIGLGVGVANDKAKSSVYNDELIDLVELALENDYDCQVENYKLFKKEELLVFNTDKGTYYFKPKKVAPFRYEWVEVEL